MTALRELLARFTVEVDPEGNLPKGNRAVDALRDKLQAVDAVAGSMGGLREFSESLGGVRALLGSGSGADGGAVQGLVKWNRALAASDHGLVRVGASMPSFATGIGKLSDYFPQAAQGGSLFGGILERLRPALDSARASLNEPRLGFISQLVTLKNAFIALGATTAARAVWGFVDSTVTAAASVNDMAQRLGVTTDQFQELQGVAQLGGADVGAVATAFSTLSRNALDFATDGGGEAAEAFGKLGLQIKDSNGNIRPAIELFYEAGDAIVGLDNATEQQALAQKLLGRSARELLPVFNDLASMTAEQRAEVRALSIVYGEDFIQAASEADDQMLITSKVLESLKSRFIGALLPVITGAAEGLQSLGKWIREATRGLSLGRIAFVAGALAISPYIQQLRALVALGGGWTKVLGNMGRGITGFLKSAAPLLAAFLVIEDVFTFFSGGDSLLGDGLIALDKALGGTGETVKQITEGFKDLWKWIGGDGQGEKAKALYRDIIQGIELLVHDLLVSVGVRSGERGLKGLNAYNAGESGLGTAGKLLGGVSRNDPFFAQLNAAGVERSGGRAGTTVIDNSTKSVQVNMSPGTSPAQVADAVSKRLEADRNSIADRVP